MAKFKNTLQKGAVRYLIFQDKSDNVWYGAGLEFNIVESGDDPQEVLLRLFSAFNGYVESAQKLKARPHILNQATDEEYERLWNHAEKIRIPKEATQNPKDVLLPYIYTHGFFSPKF